jgi:ubiquinone/menaquinone biosynthesis C-methylase UbiE
MGVDVDPEQIALTRRALGDRTHVRFATADATCLPFEDGRFDIIATNKITHHVPECWSAIAEMRRSSSHGVTSSTPT